MSADTFLFGLVGLLIGAVLIHVVAVIRDHRQPVPALRIDAPLVAVSSPLILMVAVHSTIGAWFAVCTIPVVLVIAVLFAHVRGPVLMVAVVPYLMMIVFLILTALIRCDACGRKLLLNHGRPLCFLRHLRPWLTFSSPSAALVNLFLCGPY